MRRVAEVSPDDLRLVATRAAKAVLGRDSLLADQLGMQRQAVNAWLIVPAERVRAVEAATGISRYHLRPDVFGPPKKLSRICKVLGQSLEEIAAWEQVPPECVLRIEDVTGVSRYRLRPDVFGTSPDAVPAPPVATGAPPRPRGRPRKAAPSQPTKKIEMSAGLAPAD